MDRDKIDAMMPKVRAALQMAPTPGRGAMIDFVEDLSKALAAVEAEKAALQTMFEATQEVMVKAEAERDEAREAARWLFTLVDPGEDQPEALRRLPWLGETTS